MSVVEFVQPHPSDTSYSPFWCPFRVWLKTAKVRFIKQSSSESWQYYCLLFNLSVWRIVRNDKRWDFQYFSLIKTSFFSVWKMLSHLMKSLLKSKVISTIWLALNSVIFSRITLFFALNHICSKSHHSCSKSLHFCSKSYHFCSI